MKINQRKDGLFYVSKTYKGKRYQITGKSKQEVKDKLVDLEYKLKNEAVISRYISVKDWSYKWLETYKSHVASATYTMYHSAIKNYIVPYLGLYRVDKLRESDVMNMLNEMTKRGITRRRDVALLTIKQILDKAVANDYVMKNVAAQIKIKKHVAPEKQPIPQEYINVIKAHQNEMCCRLALFLIYTGLRREEVIPLQYEDIDLEKGTITINKAVDLYHNKPVIKKTKNETTRIIPLLDVIQPQFSILGTGLIFFNQYGKIMSETSFKRQIDKVNKIVEKNVTKYERFTAHQLRHTYACILHKAGVPLKEAQYFMRSQRYKNAFEYLYAL